MKASTVSDLGSMTRTVSAYRYNAFGRRMLAQDRGGAVARTLYDGLSLVSIRSGESLADGTLTTAFSDDSVRSTGSGDDGSRYLWVSGESAERTIFIDREGFTQGAVRYTGNRAPLWANGESLALTRGDRVSYTGTDILGSTRSVTDEWGSVEDRYEYDAFGAPYEGDFGSGLDTGYTGKPLDAATGLYDYGFRDYSPQTARFTSVDPIRDGTNWFAYVNNDPVNFLDQWGLRPLTQEEINLHQAAGGGATVYTRLDVVDDGMPTKEEVRAAAEAVGVDTSKYSDEYIQKVIDNSGAMSLPDGKIYVSENARKTQEVKNSLIVHETEHQSQYQNMGEKEAFKQLIKESELGYAKYDTDGTLEKSADDLEDCADKKQQQENKKEGDKYK